MSTLPLDAKANPLDQFAIWLKAAEGSEPNDANAMNVATCALDGRPSSRMVLLKEFDARGFVFYTNVESRKGRQLAVNPFAAACLHWKSLRAQVRIEGRVEPVCDEEADAYFNSRPRDSRIGAWASEQSRPMTGRAEFEARIAKLAAKYAIGHIPRPLYWSGFRIAPERIEFWKDRPFRLHDRLVYTPLGDGGGWAVQRLYP